jgi:L,D-transpeptidase ErfK/SrfK
MSHALALSVLLLFAAPLADRLVGGEFEYAARKGDSLTSIGARFGVEGAALARNNSLDPAARLKLGQVLRVDNRHIVPRRLHEGILINVPQRMLFYFLQGKPASHYPIGLGRPSWPTPDARFTVIGKEESPTWDVPKSIQEEMRREGKVVKTKVPPCPENPLGQYWMGLSVAGYGIHGTIATASIYQFQTHGCIRLHPDDVAELFPQVPVGTPGEIIYEPALLARLEDGRIYLEAHRDVYRKVGDLFATVKNLISDHDLGGMVDWQKVEEVIRRKEGLARDVSRALPGS